MWDSITIEPGTPNHYIVTDVNGFMEHTEIENLKTLINGKRVALVCPSPSLEGLGDGDIIDSYDVVIRVNQKFKMSKEMEKDYGTKSDVLIGSFNQTNITECENNYDYIKTFKHIIGVMPSSKYQPKINFFNKMDRDGIKCTRLNDKYVYKAFKDVGTVPNSGMMGIILLMNYEIKELYITGLSFYNMGTFGNIYNSEYKDSVTSVGQTVDKGSHDHKIHKQPPQIKHLQKLHNEYPDLIKLDTYLTENLHK